MVGPDVAVERLVAVDVPVHAEHAAPPGPLVRVVVIGATERREGMKPVSDGGGGMDGRRRVGRRGFSISLLFFTLFAQSTCRKVVIPAARRPAGQ